MCFEDLPADALASRRAAVRLSDGTEDGMRCQRIGEHAFAGVPVNGM